MNNKIPKKDLDELKAYHDYHSIFRRPIEDEARGFSNKVSIIIIACMLGFMFFGWWFLC